jgi:hypothetical protein
MADGKPRKSSSSRNECLQGPSVNQRSQSGRTLSRRQRAFIREKLFGLNDKDAALAAGYSLSVAKNTKQKIWHQ